MTRDECLRLAKLTGYTFEAALELTTFIKPRLQFKTIEKLGAIINYGGTHDSAIKKE